jgi:3alpha(or 20beta)-hydroxysteroid dehydrogenase
LVTGGARGLGEAQVRALCDEGAAVVFGDILDDGGKALADELADQATYLHLDVTKDNDWMDAIAVTDGLDGIDILVNNAGIATFGGVEQLSPEAFRHIIDVSLTSVYLGMHLVIPGMRARARGGAVINISSTAGMMGYANLAGYVASKWGVRGITKAAALDLAGTGIRVNSIHPGPIRTPMTAGLPDSLYEAQVIPRIGEPDEVAKAVIYLVVDATYTIGSELVVDGGALLGPVLTIQQSVHHDEYGESPT